MARFYDNLRLAADERQLAALDEGMSYRACLPSLEGDVPDLREVHFYWRLWHPQTGVLVEFVSAEDGARSEAWAVEGATVEQAAQAGPSWTESDGWRGPSRRLGEADLLALLSGGAGAWRALFYDPDDDPAHNAPGMTRAMIGGTPGGWVVAFPDEDGVPRCGGPIAAALEAADAMEGVEALARAEGMDPARWALQDPWSAEPVPLGGGRPLPQRDELMFALDRVRGAVAAGAPKKAAPAGACAALVASEGLGEPWGARVWRVGNAGPAEAGSWRLPDRRAAEGAALAALDGDVRGLRAWELLAGAPGPRPGGWRGSVGLFERSLGEGGTLYCPDLGLLVDFDNPAGRPVLDATALPAMPEALTSVALRVAHPGEVLGAGLDPDAGWEASDLARESPDLVLDDLLGSLPATCASLAALVDDPARDWASGTGEIVRACREAVGEGAPAPGDERTFVFDVPAVLVDRAWRGDVPAGVPVTCAVSLRRRESPVGSQVQAAGWEGSLAAYVGDCRVRCRPGEFESYGMLDGGRAAPAAAVAARLARGCGPVARDVALGRVEGLVRAGAAAFRGTDLRGCPRLGDLGGLGGAGGPRPGGGGAGAVAWAWGAERLGAGAVREMAAGELLSADLAADVGDRPERLRGPCVAGDGLSWFAYTGGELPAVGTFATREAAVAFALGAGALGAEEAAELRASLAEWDRTWAPCLRPGDPPPSSPAPPDVPDQDQDEDEGAWL